MKNRFIILFSGLLLSFNLLGQVNSDSSVSKYSFVIGNLAFAADSFEIVVGDAIKGELFNYSIEIKNIGKKPINLKNGKSGKFVDITYQPNNIEPGDQGVIKIQFDAVREFPIGKMPVELVLNTDDDISPYKFLYLITNIVDGKANVKNNDFIDTVPRIIFSHYIYDFGHMNRGKKFYHPFLFTNMGSKDLIIEEIICSDGMKIYGMPNKIIAPKENASIVVKINFRAFYGLQHHTILVRTNDPVNPEIVLSVHGSVYQKSAKNKNPDFCIE